MEIFAILIEPRVSTSIAGHLHHAQADYKQQSVCSMSQHHEHNDYENIPSFIQMSHFWHTCQPKHYTLHQIYPWASSSEPPSWVIDLTKWFYFSQTIACILHMLLHASFRLITNKTLLQNTQPNFLLRRSSSLGFWPFIMYIILFVELLISSISWPNERVEECFG